MRWGRKTCPVSSDATLLYEGFVAGGDDSYAAAGTQYLCLPYKPGYSSQTALAQPMTATLFTAEYQTNNDVLPNTQGHEAPCAVCSIPRTTKFMIPGKFECPDLWTKEYDGYLMTNQDDGNYGREYVCVDEHAEIEFGPTLDTYGSCGLFFVSADCSEDSFMPCSDTGYKANMAITCVICTK